MAAHEAWLPRAMARAVMILIVLFLLTILFAWPASALEFHGMGDSDGGARAMPFSIQLPEPAYESDRCAGLLNHMRDTGVLSAAPEDTMPPPKQGLSLVIGVRFALNAPAHQSSGASFQMWQPMAENTPKAMAMAEYQDCRNAAAMHAVGWSN